VRNASQKQVENGATMTICLSRVNVIRGGENCGVLCRKRRCWRSFDRAGLCNFQVSAKRFGGYPDLVIWWPG